MEDQAVSLQQAGVSIDAQLAAGAVAAAGDAIVTVTDHAEISSWNAAAERLLGHTAEAAIGQSLALIVPAVHRPQHAAGFRAAIEAHSLARGGQPARVEGTHADGTVIPLVMSLGLIQSPDGSASGVVAILRRGDTEPISFI